MKSFPIRVVLLSGVLALSSPTLVRAWDGPFHLTDFSVADWRMNHSAKRALADDADLTKLSLGTSVKDRVVTVWGGVPSEEISKKVEATLKALPGVASVINECTIRPPEDTTAKEVASEVKKRVREKTDAPATFDEAKRNPHSVPTAEPTAEVRQSLKPLVTLGEPEMVRPEAGRATARGESLDSIKKEAKGLGMTIDLREGGDAVISGRVEKLSDAWNLAEKLAEVPEVNRVVFGSLKKR